MTYQEREELNKLSLEAFGTSSKWQKLVIRGEPEVYEREREVMVPKLDGSLVKKTFKDRKSVLRRYSVEEIRKVMTDLLAERATLKNAFPT